MAMAGMHGQKVGAVRSDGFLTNLLFEADFDGVVGISSPRGDLLRKHKGTRSPVAGIKKA